MAIIGGKKQIFTLVLSSWQAAIHVCLLVVHIAGFSLDNHAIKIACEILSIGIFIIDRKKKAMRGK